MIVTGNCSSTGLKTRTIDFLRDCINRIKREGASSRAQFYNTEAGIPSGPAAEFEESSFMESIRIQ